ncbi:MAG: hypothetical protein L0216_07745 [Planctomycetales bacterium]|nr:hypothetical protein [Planctomycetales bacterium]
MAEFGRTARTLLLAPALALVPPAAAHQEAEPPLVSFPSEWAVGEKIRLEMRKEREETRGGKALPSSGHKIPVTVEVREKKADGYVFRWTYGKAEPADPAAPRNPLAERLANLAQGLALDIRTDEDGTPEGLANPESVVSFYEKAFEVLGAEWAKAGMPAPSQEQMLRALQPFRSPETVGVAALRDPMIFFVVCGGEFRLGEKRDYEDQLPNPFGGEPFPSRAWFRMNEVRDEGREAVIEWRQTLDPEKSREILLATFKAMAEKMGTPLPAEKDLPSLSVEDQGLFVMEVATGWPRSVRHERTTLSGVQKRVDRTVFARLPPETK